jgi:hypothetical protein
MIIHPLGDPDILCTMIASDTSWDPMLQNFLEE